MKRNRLTLFLILLSLQSQAQQFGGFPPSTRWKQIETDTARIIFSKGTEVQAQRIASLVHRMAADTPVNLGNTLRKINIVLHGRTTLANGYVGLGPFRSEYYLIPGADIFSFGNLPWAENLAIHEYRHVQQYNNFRKGLSKAAYYLFGERGLDLATSMAIPNWFWEGDAVHAETALTSQGRGRLSYFLSGYNSLFADGKYYSWMKMRNGSYRDYVPNHYQLGYILVNYGYLKYGPDFWQKVTSDASSYKGVLYPFQHAVRKHSGVNFRTFRRNALVHYRLRTDKNKRQDYTATKKVTDYHFPQYLGKDSLFYLKTAYHKIPAFYRRTPDGEKKVSLKSIGAENWFSYRNGQIAYTAYSTHPRWSLVNYNDIVVLNESTGKEKRITNRKRYYTPDISPSSNKLTAVFFSDSLDSELHLLDMNGTVLNRFRLAPGEMFVNPKFIDEQQILAGIRTVDARMKLVKMDVSSGAQEELIPPSYFTIGLPSVKNDTVYFSSNFNGNDDLYALTLADKNIFRLTNGITGQYYPSSFGDSIVSSLFTSKGLQLKTYALSGLDWRRQTEFALPDQTIPFPVALASRNLLQTPTRRFAEKRYTKSTGLLNFHSWSPDYTDPEFTFSLYSDNILNTFSNTLFYRYNHNETSHAAGFNSSYGGFFPMLNAGFEYTFDRTIERTSDTLTLNQLEARIGYNIPLNLTRDKTYKFLNFGTNLAYTQTRPTGRFKDSTGGTSLNYLHHFISFSQQLPRAFQHLFPKFGWSAVLNLRHALDRKAYQALAGTQLALPSFGNHSLVLGGSFQEIDTANIVFSNRFSNARGYPDVYNPRMWRVSGNYHLPLWYPDLGVANIVYVRRLRANLFYDLSSIYSRNKSSSTRLRSTGAELFFDTRWWNSLPLSFGFRYSYLLDNDKFRSLGKHQFEFTLPMDLIPD